MRAEVIDRDQHEAARAAKLHRFVERDRESLGQRIAVHLAGEAVEARQVGKPLLVIVALVDDAHHAVRARRAPVGTGEPAAIVLDPQPGRAVRAGEQAIFGLIGNAVAGIEPAGLHHGVVARRRVGRIEEARIAAPGPSAAISRTCSTSAAFAPQTIVSVSTRQS